MTIGSPVFIREQDCNSVWFNLPDACDVGAELADTDHCEIDCRVVP
jgi:hypothetical protein